jgi:DNA-directed RNA polymerase specialized sigma24 family protein
MSSKDGSVTQLIDAAKIGNEIAAQALWDRYYKRLTRLARKLMPEMDRQVFDEEDVALSAMDTLFQRLRTGQLPDLYGREELWRWLAVVTSRKALGRLRYEHRKKRKSERAPSGNVEQVVSTAPPPDLELMITEEFERLLDRLGDDTLRQVALWKMDGATNDDIAQWLGCARRTVARKLELIRGIWSIEDH